MPFKKFPPLPCPNDYGQELEQQSARKAAKEFEWSGRHEPVDKRLLASVIVSAVCTHLAYGATTDELIDTVEKLLTSAHGGV